MIEVTKLQTESFETEGLDGVRGKLALLIVAAALAMGLSALSACSNPSKKIDADTAAESSSMPESAANRVAREADAAYFVDVEFQKGSDELTEQSRAAISSLLNRARAEGHVRDVKVLSWADEEYPSASRKKLSEAQRRLAKSRNRSITNHVKTIDYGIRIDAHSMAERPGVVSKWLNTSDARFKRSLLAAGLPTTSDPGVTPSRASHSVVLVTLK